MYEQRENINKEFIKRDQTEILGLKNTITELKSLLEVFKSRLELREERISSLEDRIIEMIKSEDLGRCVSHRQVNQYMYCGVPRWRRERSFEQIMAKIYSIWLKNMNL